MLALAQVGPGPAGAQQQTKRELDAAKAELRDLARDLEAAQAHYEQVQADLAAATRRVAELTAQAEALRAAIAEVEKGIRKTRREVKELQASLNSRARTAYINGPATALELVLEAESLGNLTDRLSYLEVLSQGDSDVAAGLQVRRERLDRYKSELGGYLAQLQPVLEEARAEQGTLQQKQEAAAAAEAALDDKVAESEALVERLRKQYERELAAQLAAARAAQAAAGSVGGNVGPPVSADGPLYWCPVDRPRSYIDTFGAPRSGGRSHQGNDIFAPYGTPIRAPFEGTARESSNSLGGLAVYVYAPNGDFVYNAHLSSYAGVSGQHVQRGDLIGYVGTSGNAQGTSPHNHFEYHPGGGSAVSPYLYLNEVCGVNGSG
ncbi:MAG TPA: peptidoglycan DD-metalloendopeptidase family protein [Actinomycetota bacterium]|nr:peptidoglycan DD-metalloendopeptidase family protein [Actinomycetota bacterium]